MPQPINSASRAKRTLGGFGHEALKSTSRRVRVCACSQASGVSADTSDAGYVPPWPNGQTRRRTSNPKIAGSREAAIVIRAPNDGWQIWRLKARSTRELSSCSTSHLPRPSRAPSQPSRSTRTCWLTHTTERLPPMSGTKSGDLIVQQKAQDKFQPLMEGSAGSGFGLQPRQQPCRAGSHHVRVGS